MPHNHLVKKQTLKQSAKLTKWLSCVGCIYLYGAYDCVFVSHVLYTFQNESTLYSCLNVKELLARNRREI